MLALHFNVNSKYSQKLPVLLLTCIQLFITGLIGLLISSLVEMVPEEVSTSIWIWFALSTLLATSLRYVMQTWDRSCSSGQRSADYDSRTRVDCDT